MNEYTITPKINTNDQINFSCVLTGVKSPKPTVAKVVIAK